MKACVHLLHTSLQRQFVAGYSCSKMSMALTKYSMYFLLSEEREEELVESFEMFFPDSHVSSLTKHCL